MTPKESSPEIKAFWNDLEEGISKVLNDLGEKHPTIRSDQVCSMFVSLVAQMTLEIEKTPEQYHVEHRVILCRQILDKLNAYHTFCDHVKIGMMRNRAEKN